MNNSINGFFYWHIIPIDMLLLSWRVCAFQWFNMSQQRHISSLDRAHIGVKWSFDVRAGKKCIEGLPAFFPPDIFLLLCVCARENRDGTTGQEVRMWRGHGTTLWGNVICDLGACVETPALSDRLSNIASARGCKTRLFFKYFVFGLGTAAIVSGVLCFNAFGTR